MRRALFVVCLLAFSVLAQTKQKDHTKYFPLTEGSKWEYIWEEEEKVLMSVSTHVVKIIDNDIVVEEEHTVGYIAPSTKLLTYTIKNSLILETGMGGGFSKREYEKYLTRSIILMLPIKIGKEWEYERNDGKWISCKVLKWHDTFQTKYGKYRDVFEILEKIHNKEEKSILYRYRFFAYGIGVVYEDYDNSGDGTGERGLGFSLTSYQVK